jgi:hypothetical protein
MCRAWLLAVLTVAGCTGQISGPSNQSGGQGSVSGDPATQQAPLDCTEVSPSPRLLRQLTRAEYASTVADLFGLAGADTTAIPPDRSVRGFTNNVGAAFVDEAHLDAYASVAAGLAERAIQETYPTLVPCSVEDDTCAATFIENFGQRAFRRPLTEAEKARYLGLFSVELTGGQFQKGVELTIRSLLISPSFIYRSELGESSAAGDFTLTPYEVASALSYTFWGTMPDAALFGAAQSGALANKTEVEAQARRLLADPRGRVTIARFFYEWLESPRAYVASKDEASFPALFAQPGGVEAILGAMREEEDAFVTHVVFDSTRRFDELFSASYTFANAALAAYYGLDTTGLGSVTQRVELGAGSQRGGLLTLGMLLFGHARTTASSPTQRGHMIRASLLCEDISPPPPNVDTAITPAMPGNTTRQQILGLTSQGSCPSCHTLQDPIGFGLEAFDGAAAFRTMDNGEPVDATGEIVGISGPNGEALTFDGARELSAVIGNLDKTRACFATNYYRFARGFDPKGEDGCAVSELARDFIDADLEIPELFVRLVLQDSFVARRSAEVLDP